MNAGKEQTGCGCDLEWLHSGGVGLPRMLEAIELAARTVEFEMYIFWPGGPGDEFRLALIAAAERGVRVRVLLDALGSGRLPDDYWRTLRRVGGEVRYFHPMRNRLALVRDHRKLLVCDDRVAFVVGFNVAAAYDGDGVDTGWRDAGILVRGTVAAGLRGLFDEQFEVAAARQPWTARLRRRAEQAAPYCQESVQILPVTPGRGPSCFTDQLLADLAETSRMRGEATLVCPYVVPTAPVRKALRRAVKAGAKVRMVLPMQNDVRLSQLASRRLYAGFLRAGIRIHEYEPQVLHAKVFLFPHAVYVGSSNLDPRSLHLNFELMLRVEDSDLLARARADVEDVLGRSREIERRGWARSRSWWTRLREEWAFWVLYRIDPWLTSRAGRRPAAQGASTTR